MNDKWEPLHELIEELLRMTLFGQGYCTSTAEKDLVRTYYGCRWRKFIQNKIENIQAMSREDGDGE